MKLSVFPSSIETSRALILRLVEIMNEEPDRVFNIAVSGGNTPALMFDLWAVSYTHLRAHETAANLVCRLLLEKKK